MNSLYFRLLLLVVAIVVGTVALLSFLTLRSFEEASTFQLEHEAVMLSDAVKAAILPTLRGDGNVGEIQDRIDRIAEAREKNDIEINILLLEGDRSSIVASNIPDNVGSPSVYEHRDMLTALEEDRTIAFVGRDDDSDSEPESSPDSPDFYIAPGHRFVSVTRPLAHAGKRFGAINTKISLFQIDHRLGSIRNKIILIGFSLPTVALILMGLAIRSGLQPLNRLAGEVAQIQVTGLGYRFETGGLPRELAPIGARLNELLERLEASFKRERRFSADVAHELRTPIATLKAIAQVGLQEVSQGKRPKNEMDFLKDTLEVTNQMERLVDSLLSLVRCESNQMKPRRESIDLKVVVKSTWELFREIAGKKGIVSRFDLGEPGPLLTDPALVEGMLTNLFSNSVQYTESGGTIACSLESQNGEVSFNLENSTRALVREDLDHLSEPFWRKDAARSDSTHCGIGLSLVSAYSRILGVVMEMDLPRSDLFRVRLRFPLKIVGSA